MYTFLLTDYYCVHFWINLELFNYEVFIGVLLCVDLIVTLENKKHEHENNIFYYILYSVHT